MTPDLSLGLPYSASGGKKSAVTSPRSGVIVGDAWGLLDPPAAAAAVTPDVRLLSGG